MGEEVLNKRNEKVKKTTRSKWLPSHWSNYNYLEHYPFYVERLSHFSASSADLYALTMAQALMDHDKHDLQTVFHGYIRKNPFKGEYLIAAGQNIVHEWLDHWSFDAEDIALLKEKKVLDPETNTLKPLFTDDFLDMLENAELELTIEAVPEGELIFPDEPIYRITGPLWQALMVEAFILNTTNSQSLFATLAARLRESIDGPIVGFSANEGVSPLIEAGFRRAQTIGGLEVARAGFIGGFNSTSNVAAEKYYKIPTGGTMAHALVMTYENELDAFREYAESMPYNGVFLIDTYDTLEGAKKAIQACQEKGISLKGVRLDSGDLAQLSIQVRKILDEAGFTEAKIAASNDLDEDKITAIRQAGGKIDMWVVGTNFVTSKKQPALGGVYKLGGVFEPSVDGAQVSQWRDDLENQKYPTEISEKIRDVIKLSEDQVKITLPGAIDTLRFIFNEEGMAVLSENSKDITSAQKTDDFVMDVIVDYWGRPELDENGCLVKDLVVAAKNTPDETFVIPAGMKAYRPMKTMFENGKAAHEPETVHEARTRAHKQIERLSPDVRRLTNAAKYPVYVSQELLQKRRNLAAKRGYSL